MVENAGPAQVRVFRSGNTNDAVSVRLTIRGEPTVLLQKVLWLNFEVLIQFCLSVVIPYLFLY